MARKADKQYTLPPRLEYLMRIGLVDRSKLQQYKLAFKNPENNVKFQIYREKILEVFFKVFDIMAKNDPIYEKVRQQVIIQYRKARDKKMKKHVSITEMDDHTVNKATKAHEDLLNLPKDKRGKGWASDTVKALSVKNKAIRDREARNQAAQHNPDTRMGTEINPLKQKVKIAQLIQKKKYEQRMNDKPTDAAPKQYPARLPPRADIGEKNKTDTKKVEAKRTLFQKLFRK